MLAQEFFASGQPSLQLGETDAVLWLQVPAGKYAVAVAGAGSEAGLVDVDVYLAGQLRHPL
jgi:hypothetical protein